MNHKLWSGICFKNLFHYLRRKYRNDPPGEQGYGNLMFDRRIVRGNTYAQTMLPINAQVKTWIFWILHIF